MAFKIIPQTDFSGGVNYVVNPYLMNQKQAMRLQNLILDEHGSLHTRGGLRTLTTSVDVGHPIILRSLFVKNDGTQFPLAIHSLPTGNKLYRTSPWGLIGTFTTNELTPFMVQINNKAVFLNGYETPFEWDGFTFVRITASGGQTVPPGAKHGVFHLGAMWIWNTNPATTSLDGPSALRASDPNNPDSWPNANQTFVSKDDGQVGMGCASFTIVETGISPTATLVLFKNFSAYEVTGVFGASNFSVQQVKSDMGCIASRTIQFLSGFGIVRLTHKGFALYNGVEDRLISEEVRPLIFGGVSGNEFIAGLDFDNVAVSWAAQIPNPPIYIAACSVGGGELTRIFLYDLVRRAWTIADFPVSLSCLSLMLFPNSIPIVHAGAFAGGKIYEVFPINVFDDDNKHVNWKLKTRVFFHSNQMNPTYFRRMQFNILGEPRHPVDVTPIIDGTPAQTQRFLMPDIGIGIPDHTAAAPLVDTVFSVDIMRSGHTVQFEIDGVGRSYIRGLEVHTIQKPPQPYRAEPVRTLGTIPPPVVHTFLSLCKFKVPAGMNNTWNFYVDGNLVATNLDDNVSVVVEVTPGFHTVTEALATGSNTAVLPPVFGGDLDTNGNIIVAANTTASGTVTNIGGLIDTSRMLTTGFEEGGASCFLNGNTNVLQSVIFSTVGGVFSAPSIVTDFTHTGTYSLKLFGLGGGAGTFSANLQKIFDPQLGYPNSLGYRMYAYYNTGDSTPARLIHHAAIGTGNDHEYMAAGYVSGNSSTTFHPLIERGRFQDNTVTGTSTLVTGQWYRIELWTDYQANGAFTTTGVWYSDDSLTPIETLTFSGPAGTINTSHNLSLFIFTPTYGIAPAAIDARIDDLVIFKKSGPYGPGHCVLSDFNSIVSAQWTPVGNTNNLLTITALPTNYPLPTSSNNTSVDGNVDKFTINNPVPSGKTVTAIDFYVQGVVAANATMTQSMYINVAATNTFIEQEGPSFVGGALLPATGSGGHLAFAMPAGTFDSVVGSLQFGYRSKLSGGPRDVSLAWVNIEYVN